MESSMRAYHKWGAQKLAKGYSSKSTLGQDLSHSELSNDLGIILGSGKDSGERIDRDELISKSLSVLLKTSESDSGYFYLQKNDSDLIKCSHLGLECKDDLLPLVNYVFRTKMELCSNILEHKRLVEIIGETDYEILCFPISSKGVLILINSENNNHFNKEVLKITNLLIQQLEMSLDNMEMYERLTLFNKELEDQVTLRTRELKNERDKAQSIANDLKNAQKEIVKSAKDAGRAEVAANVLHNIGNSSMFVIGQFDILKRKLHDDNSIEVLNALISKIESYPGNISEFIEKDPIGLKLPDFLKEVTKLSNEFIQKQDHRLSRIEDKLRLMMKMIKEENRNIHGYALLEASDLKLLVEEASVLTGLNETLEHLIKIDTDEHPKIDFEKVKNILINLYSNSVKSCESIERRAQVHTLIKIRGEKIILEVSDNGQGMSPATLNSVFTPGFSTKGTSGGYGLHNSSVVAQNLGGTLVAKSDGLQMGATFILELPFLK